MATNHDKARGFYCGSDIDEKLGLSLAEFRLLFHLSRRAGQNGDAYPGIASIAEICRMNKDTAVAAVRELERRGIVIAARSPGRVTHYRLADTAQWDWNHSLKSDGNHSLKPDAPSPETGDPPFPETGCTIRKEGNEGIPSEGIPSEGIPSKNNNNSNKGSISLVKTLTLKDLKKNCDRLPEEEWVNQLKAQAEFSGINIEQEFGNFAQYRKQKKLSPATRRTFISWLERYQKPIGDELKDWGLGGGSNRLLQDNKTTEEWGWS